MQDEACRSNQSSSTSQELFTLFMALGRDWELRYTATHASWHVSQLGGGRGLYKARANGQ